MKIKTLLVSVVFSCSTAAFASPGHHTPPAMPKEFEMLKKLVGTWEGKTKMDEKEQEMTVIYELTSGGTAVTEKLMSGTPDEMISVYYKEGKTLAMTHYCAMGNAPHMPLKKADATMLAFEMTKPRGLTSMNESHMHAVTLKLDGDDRLTHEWVHFENGKKKGVTVFQLKRKK